MIGSYNKLYSKDIVIQSMDNITKLYNIER